MAHRYARGKSKPESHAFLAFCFALLIVFFPHPLSGLDFRSVFSHGLNVSAYKASPAYAAFEDLNEIYSPLPDISAQGRHIGAGQRYDPQVLAKNIPVQRQLALHGLTIHLPAEVRPEKPYLLASAALARSALDPAAPFAGEKPAKLTSRAMSWSRLLGTDLAPEEQSASGPRPAIEIAANKMNPALAPPTGAVASVSVSRSLRLNGQIEMTGGLAFVGSETNILVKRVLNGRTLERGHIWVTEGKFEINVEQATGYLVAELSKHNGEILGRGEINLTDLRGLHRTDSGIGDLRIALRPTPDVASMRTISSYTPPSPGGLPSRLAGAKVEIEALADAQPVNDEGYFSDPSLTRDSTFIARASAKKHWPSLIVGTAGRPRDIRLFPNTLIEALTNLGLTNGADRREARQLGVVWGQVTKNGQPLSGATVELAGDYRPIYLNEAYLPDPALSSTGRNGIFAFLRVQSGTQALRVRIGGQIFPAQIFVSETRHVSYLELDLKENVQVQFKLYDSFSRHNYLAGEIKLFGRDDGILVHATGLLRYATSANPYFAEASSGSEYLTSRVTLTDTSERASVPLVRRAWLKDLMAQRGIAEVPGRGTVMGWIDNEDFEIEMTGFNPQEASQIVYLDPQGQPLDSNSGVAGGGFVIVNAPQGLQTVYVHAHASRSTFSQLAVAEPGYVHVMVWSQN